MSQYQVRKVIHWLLLIVVILYLIAGFGITEFRVVEAFTFGLLTKGLAFSIHSMLWIPFVILLVLHICFSPLYRLFCKARRAAKLRMEPAK